MAKKQEDLIDLIQKMLDKYNETKLANQKNNDK
jgi:hypothetical protein